MAAQTHTAGIRYLTAILGSKPIIFTGLIYTNPRSDHFCVNELNALSFFSFWPKIWKAISFLPLQSCRLWLCQEYIDSASCTSEGMSPSKIRTDLYIAEMHATENTTQKTDSIPTRFLWIYVVTLIFEVQTQRCCPSCV